MVSFINVAVVSFINVAVVSFTNVAMVPFINMAMVSFIKVASLECKEENCKRWEVNFFSLQLRRILLVLTFQLVCMKLVQENGTYSAI